MGKNVKVEKALGLRLDPELYDRLAKAAEAMDSPVTHVIAGAIESTLDLIEAKSNTRDVPLPKYVAIARLKIYWSDIDYEGDITVSSKRKKS